jgi:hypothetical protein
MNFRTITIIFLLAALIPGGVAVCQGQVQIDLRTQSKSVDFGQASSTRPFQTGAILPAACQQGQVYYLTTAAAGQNIHLCQATGQWSKVIPEELDSANYSQSFASATSVTLAHNSGSESVVPFCVDANGDAIEWNGFRIVDPNTAVVTFSTPQSGRCVVNRSGGGGGGGTSLLTSPTITVVGDRADVNGSVIPAYTAGATSLTFGAIGNASCGNLTMAVSGAMNGDSIAEGWPSAMPAGFTGTMFVSSADSVTVRLCNLSGGTVTPAAGLTFKATIIRGF